MKNKMLINNDPELSLERNGYLRKIFNFFLIPVLNLLPVKSRYFVRRSHRAVRDIVDNATNHAALEILYKKGNVIPRKNFYEFFSHWIWFNTNNSKAVRNRIKLVKKELGIALQEISRTKSNIKILSIASGSARAVIESIHAFDGKSNIHIESTFLDRNAEALEYSKNLLYTIGLNNEPTHFYTWINGTAGSYLKGTHEKYDIVEMVGLMDYFDDQKAQEIFTSIYGVLNTGGIFITANINKNAETPFVTKAIGWPMIYRSVNELAQLVEKSGFACNKINFYYEPHTIHGIVVAHK